MKQRLKFLQSFGCKFGAIVSDWKQGPHLMKRILETSSREMGLTLPTRLRIEPPALGALIVGSCWRLALGGQPARDLNEIRSQSHKAVSFGTRRNRSGAQSSSAVRLHLNRARASYATVVVSARQSPLRTRYADAVLPILNESSESSGCMS
jgi:hypothetical protein